MTPLYTILALLSGCSTLELAESAAPAMDEELADGVATNAPKGTRARGSGQNASVLQGGVAGGDAEGVSGFDLGYAEAAEAPAKPAPADDAAAETAESTRSWFPEAFLWQPRVVTDASGKATLDVPVPDQLTTWRVLALAHDRSGQQAGTVHQFDTRLPVYVEPVVPGWLMAGDALQLPVQVVNGSDEAVTAELQVRASGSVRGLGTASLRLAPGASDVRYIPLRVRGAGPADVRAELRSDAARDAALRSIPVQPVGRPVVHTFGSTLASERTFALPGEPGADPTTERVTVSVFPGPLSVLQAEVERLLTGNQVERGSYAFLVATHLSDLAVQRGLEVDPERQRRLQLLAWQRMVREVRGSSTTTLGTMLIATATADLPMMEELRSRLVRMVLDTQRADGTWSQDARSTMQRVLVETATQARGLPTTETGARLRAMGAVERYAREVSDAYTAAVILAARLAEGPIREHLQSVLEEGLTTTSSGARSLPVPDAVLNARGVRPHRAEVLGWGVLALPEDHPARGDLAAELMSAWSAARGFGAGEGDVVALQAVASALAGASEPVEVVVRQGDRELGRGTVDPAQPHQPTTIEASALGDAPFTVSASPAVAGMAFVATRHGYVPWSGRERGIDGVDVDVSLGALKRGQRGSLTIEVAAPSGTRLVIEQGLPAGTDASLASDVNGTVESGRVRVTTGVFGAGEVKSIEVGVVPGFAGTFQTGPLRVAVIGGSEAQLRPEVWRIAP